MRVPELPDKLSGHRGLLGRRPLSKTIQTPKIQEEPTNRLDEFKDDYRKSKPNQICNLHGTRDCGTRYRGVVGDSASFHSPVSREMKR